MNYAKHPLRALATMAVLLLATFFGCGPKTDVLEATTSQHAGPISAKFKINANGEVMWKAELLTPPGTNKMGPQLKLLYESQTTGGTFGKGFGLQGLSSIKRIGATPQADGFKGGVYYDRRDRFQLDDSRLIATSGTYGASGSVYHTQVESWKKVVASGQCGSGPCSFSVTNKNGTVYEYGTTADSKVLASGQGNFNGSVREWLVNKATDLSGNSMTLSYTQQPRGTNGNVLGDFSAFGQSYPQRIDYTQNANLPTRRSVQFFYEIRPDTAPQFVGGAKIQTLARVAAIRSFVYNENGDSTLAQGYEFHYDPHSPQNVSRIDTLKQVGSDGSTLAPTSIDWTGSANGFVKQPNFPFGGTGSNDGWAGDFNGDGITDIMPRNNGSPTKLYFGGAAGFTEQPLSPAPLLSTYTWTGDFNADGLDDILTLSGSVGKLYFANGTGFDNYVSVPSLHFSNGCTSCAWVADYNGDGRADLFTRVGSTGYYIYFGDSTKNGLMSPRTVNDPTMNLNQGLTFSMDFTGDGLADFLSVSNTKGTLYPSNWSDSTGFRSGISLTNLNLNKSCQTCTMLMDVNGDGLPDLFSHVNGGYNVYFANGAGFEGGQPIHGVRINTNYNWTGDYNGDGWVDFYVPGSHSDTIFYSNGFSYEAIGVPSNSFLSTGTWNGDFNGDGLGDIFSANVSTMFFGGTQGGQLATSNQVPHMAASIDNGVGGVWEMTYMPLTSSEVYQTTGTGSGKHIAGERLLNRYASIPSAFKTGSAVNPGSPVNPYPIRLVQNAQFVTRQYSNSDGLGHTRLFDYYYQNARTDLSGPGWLGFETVRHTDQSTGKLITLDYLQAFPFTGKTISKSVSCDSVYGKDPKCKPNALLSAVATTYFCDGTGPCSGSDATDYQPYPGVFQVLKASQQTSTYDYGTYAYKIGTNYAYDFYGNQTLKSYLGYLSSGGGDLGSNDNVYTLTAFHNDTSGGKWLMGFQTAQKLSTSNDASGMSAVACGGTSGFSNTDDLQLSAVTYSTDGRMLQLQTCEWNNVDAVWLTDRYGYDAYGNKTLSVNPGGDSTHTTFDPVYQTFADKTTSPPNVSGQSLDQYTGFDPRNGTQIATADPNGNVVVTVLDGFARTAAIQSPLPEVSGVTPSTNEVSSWVTGSYDFAAAEVITTQTGTWMYADSGYYNQVSNLQTWPTSGNPVWGFTQAWYDGHSQNYMNVRQGSSGSPGNVVYWKALNSSGNPTSISYAFFSNEKPVVNSMAYDIYGRMVKTVMRRGATGQDSSVVACDYSYNSVGQVNHQTSGDAGASYERIVTKRSWNDKVVMDSIIVPADSNAVTLFGHDVLGNLTSARTPETASSPAGLTTSLKYDALGRKIQITAPGPGTVNLSYDADGNLDSITDALGSLVYAYDALGRMRTQTWWDGTVIDFTYDDTSMTNGLGHLTGVSMTGPGGAPASSYAYGYDGAGNKIYDALTIAGAPRTYVTQYVKDPLQRQVSMQYPDGSTLVATFDQGNLASMAIDDTTYVTYADFIAAGNAGTMTYYNGVETKMSYDVSSLQSGQKIAKGDVAYLHDSLTWNGLFEVVSAEDLLKTNGDWSKTFAYDNLRLKTASSPGTYGDLSYEFDPSGNLLVKDSMTFAYTGYQADSAVAGGRTVFRAGYDAVGNMTSRYIDGTEYSFSYDAMRHLVQAVNENPKDTVRMQVDYLGRRIARWDTDGTVTYYAGTGFEEVVSGGMTQQTRHVLGPVERIASLTSGWQGPGGPGDPTVGTVYFHADRLGSTTITTDAAGDTASSVLYDPFGGMYAMRGENNYSFKFTGQELDEGIGLYYYDARFYDPALGRFTSADIGLGGHVSQQDVFNRYEYVLGNPVKYNDPSGHKVGLDILTGLIVAASVVLDIVEPELIPETVELDFEVVEETEAVSAAESITEEAADDCGCFTRYTEVETSEGVKAIQDIQVGDSVLAFDDSTGRIAMKPVTEVFRWVRDHMIEIFAPDNRIETTEDHPYHTQRGWVKAKDLRRGDRMRLADGGALEVDSTRRRAGKYVVYNFEVGDWHTYFVADARVLVHNPMCKITRKKYTDQKGNLKGETVDATLDKSNYRQGSGTDVAAREFVNDDKTPIPRRIDYQYEYYDPNSSTWKAGGKTDIQNSFVQGKRWDAGHIIGRQLGGSGTDPANLFPQNIYINRGWQGEFNEWRRIENEVASLMQQTTVKVRITFYY